MSGTTVKTFMYLNRKAPHGTIYALESLEVMLIGSAFDQTVSLAFVDDGVYQIVKDQDTTGIGQKNFSAAYRALADYDITQLYVERDSLQARNLSAVDLMNLVYEDEHDDWAEKPSIRIVSSAELAAVLDDQNVILSF